jgi:hypothetical protein
MEGKSEIMRTSEQVGSERPGSYFGRHNDAVDFQVRDDMWVSQHSGYGGRDDNEIPISTGILADFDFTEKEMASFSMRISYLLEVYKLERGSINT